MQYTTSSRAWHSGCIEAECASELYARYLCSRDALGQARRATIGYLVYKRASKGILHITSMIKSKDGHVRLHIYIFVRCHFVVQVRRTSIVIFTANIGLSSIYMTALYEELVKSGKKWEKVQRIAKKW